MNFDYKFSFYKSLIKIKTHLKIVGGGSHFWSTNSAKWNKNRLPRRMAKIALWNGYSISFVNDYIIKYVKSQEEDCQ